jgi:hypothetical protein
MPNKVKSNLCAYLGNSGECFDEQFSNYYLNKEFVEAGIVKVYEVSEDFADTFKVANLDRLSLCNIFNQ